MTPTRLSTCAFLLLGAGLVSLVHAESRLAREAGDEPQEAVALKSPLRTASPRVAADESQNRRRARNGAALPSGALHQWWYEIAGRHSALRGMVPPLGAPLLPDWEIDWSLFGELQSSLSGALHSTASTHYSLPLPDIHGPVDPEVVASRAKYPDQGDFRFTSVWAFLRGCLRAPDSFMA